MVTQPTMSVPLYSCNNYITLKMAVLGENIANKTHHKH
jgi:hypothetical protein